MVVDGPSGGTAAAVDRANDRSCVGTADAGRVEVPPSGRYLAVADGAQCAFVELHADQSNAPEWAVFMFLVFDVAFMELSSFFCWKTMSWLIFWVLSRKWLGNGWKRTEMPFQIVVSFHRPHAVRACRRQRDRPRT
ncbi:hypothetical protein SAMN05216276_1003148 [Streptosporangium subroseum]|uniref:Uncharacterized protein n=1 Tax=Streptosporangium subroseum TaxID=106412 RepID=A0A239BFN9_9ACTN|nr:hypothetical protein [Streptosporangium subroseum]SNS06168.1 hypothetical protein SAMN05216276_1003148 [Streptosporangium subroseum]